MCCWAAAASAARQRHTAHVGVRARKTRRHDRAVSDDQDQWSATMFGDVGWRPAGCQDRALSPSPRDRPCSNPLPRVQTPHRAGASCRAVALRRLDHRRIEDRAALEHNPLASTDADQCQNFVVSPASFSRRGPAHVVGRAWPAPCQARRTFERQPVAQRLCEIAIGQVVPLRQQQRADQHDRRKWRTPVQLRQCFSSRYEAAPNQKHASR